MWILGGQAPICIYLYIHMQRSTYANIDANVYTYKGPAQERLGELAVTRRTVARKLAGNLENNHVLAGSCRCRLVRSPLLIGSWINVAIASMQEPVRFIFGSCLVNIIISGVVMMNQYTGSPDLHFTLLVQGEEKTCISLSLTATTTTAMTTTTRITTTTATTNYC